MIGKSTPVILHTTSKRCTPEHVADYGSENDANMQSYRLERVEAGSNWLFPFDQISPIEI